MIDSEQFNRLRAQVEFPEAWKPHEGSPSTLVGQVVSWTEIPFRDRATDEERRQAALVVRDTDEKEWTVATFHTVLANELLRNKKIDGQVEPGDFVAIHYRGLKERQRGDGTVHSYRVAIERPGPGGGEGDDGSIPF